MTSSSSIKAVLLDLDDTLWSITPVIHHAEIVLHSWLTDHAPMVAQRFSIEQLRLRRLELMATDPYFQLDLWALRYAGLKEAFILAGENTDKIEHAMAVFSQARNRVTFFEDVLPCLNRLKTRVILGTVSNGVADLDAIGIADHFQISVSARQIGCAKPNPVIFQHTCAQLNVAPNETVYVGDDLLLDVEGAQKAGLKGVWMQRFNQKRIPHVTPDGICCNLYEFENWLNNNI